MCLRKSPELTPELVAAARRNAQHATGPRSEAGKEKVKMNAVKHGFYSAPENHQLTMLALGEDPQEYEALIEQMMTTYGPGDDLWKKQIEDLAKLYWRRSRLERMQAGVMRRALLEVEQWQHRREREMANATFEPSHYEMLETGMAEPSDEGVRLRTILSTLGAIRAIVAQTSGGPQSAIDNQQTAINNRQSTISRQSAIGHRQSAIDIGILGESATAQARNPLPGQDGLADGSHLPVAPPLLGLEPRRPGRGRRDSAGVRVRPTGTSPPAG